MKIYPKYGTFFILLLLPFVTHALGFEIVHDPWNEIQNATTATNSVTTAVNSGKMLANQLTELANQARLLQIELANIKSYQGQKSWSNAEPLLQQLAKQIAETQTLAYSMQNVDSAFQTLYPGFQAPTDYPTSYQRWSTTTLNTLRTTLDAAGIQAQHFDAEQEALNQLATLSDNAAGHLQALQAGSRIAAAQVTQLQALRQLVIAQTNAQNAYMAYQVQKDQASEAALTKWLGKGKSSFSRYGQGVGFGASNVPTLGH